MFNYYMKLQRFPLAILTSFKSRIIRNVNRLVLLRAGNLFKVVPGEDH